LGSGWFTSTAFRKDLHHNCDCSFLWQRAFAPRSHIRIAKLSHLAWHCPACPVQLQYSIWRVSALGIRPFCSAFECFGCRVQYETDSGSILDDRIARNIHGSLLHTSLYVHEVLGFSHQMQERVGDSSHDRRPSPSRESTLSCVTVSSRLRCVQIVVDVSSFRCFHDLVSQSRFFNFDLDASSKKVALNPQKPQRTKNASFPETRRYGLSNSWALSTHATGDRNTMCFVRGRSAETIAFRLNQAPDSQTPRLASL
jgi:hypothetical protein